MLHEESSVAKGAGNHSAPLVSVVMPIYDAAPFLNAALDSVRVQDWPDLELIAVNDGSTDGSGDILQAAAADWVGPGRRLVVLEQQNAGAAAARNAGVARAQGDILALFDSDDIYHPSLVSRLVAALGGEAIMSFAMYRYIDETGRHTGTETAPGAEALQLRELLRNNWVHAPVFSREAWDLAGPLDETLRAHIDLDFFARLVKRRPGAIRLVPDALSDYRRRSGQITGDWRRMRRAWLHVHRKLRRDGLRLSPAELRRIHAGLRIYWASLAYQSGDYATARRLTARAWRGDPAGLLREAHPRTLALACVTSLLPDGLHHAIRDLYRARTTETA
ncbi:putative glycosyltransferase protein [Pseudooceanicola batsensis HTCC2597]|uniref:Putative glycosyltransferase protein n=1 Tax=Pseudooceanicola batsensis (strain ATCC BAA-863 / DSM 15984 / KCTC 12145 / HTCC2597) TaxID=252305 RepID=A3U2J5_PSEBH|nr:glycosyltransferase family 2 protein [Pseudooceanicola batsensis]EAQ01569.1 putative glycosyltransferase protein [Pseudooceanicola batsensis HTCC2597]